MMRTALASAAILGAVMVAPAQSAGLPDVDPYTTTGVTATLLAAYTNWTNVWTPFFAALDPNFSFASNGSLPTFFGAIFQTSGGSPLSQGFVVISGTASYNLPKAGSVPVPGPIAGAGLPLLAAGIAFAAWRRRRAANAA